MLLWLAIKETLRKIELSILYMKYLRDFSIKFFRIYFGKSERPLLLSSKCFSIKAVISLLSMMPFNLFSSSLMFSLASTRNVILSLKSIGNIWTRHFCTWTVFEKTKATIYEFLSSVLIPKDSDLTKFHVTIDSMHL